MAGCGARSTPARCSSRPSCPYGTTDSAPGVATLATGRLPREHGVVSDAPWFRDERRQRLCVADAATRTVSSYDWVVAEGASASSAVLVGDGFAELLRAAAPGAKSVVLGAKGLDVALLGGRAPDLAAWWDPYGRGFVSSTAFVDALPAWLAAWNARWFEPVRDWSWTSTLPAAPAELAAAADERAGGAAGRRAAAPAVPAPELPATLAPVHQAHLAARAFASPLVDRLCVDAALAALDGAALGDDDVPDLLALALGGSDLVVRATGPYSVETTDAVLRLDRELGRLFDALDARLGRDGWLGVVASERGVLELP
ncbi:MAG: alkaline phosphatase family protein [Planctomycetes bacterium]|nr:alkaline phosphatase family protein [Planctomycetota bacterium]